MRQETTRRPGGNGGVGGEEAAPPMRGTEQPQGQQQTRIVWVETAMRNDARPGTCPVCDQPADKPHRGMML